MKVKVNKGKGAEVDYRLKAPKDVNELDKILGLEADEEKMKVVRRSGITSSELCWRAYLLNYVYGIRPVKRAPGMDQSSYVHMVVAMLLRGMKPDDVMGIVDQLLQDVCADSGKATDPDRAKDASMGYAVGCYLYDRLVDFVKDKGFEIINIEDKFEGSMRVEDQDGTVFDLPYRLQLDFVIRNPSTGNLYIWDTKAVATDLALYGLGCVLGLQASSYPLWGKQESVLGGKVKGIVFGLVSKPTISRKGLTRGEEQHIEDYVSEVYENLDGTGRWIKLKAKRSEKLPLIIKPFTPDKRRTDDAVVRWLDWHKRMERGRNLLNAPMHENCIKGFMVCPYTEFCQRPCKMWKGILNEKGGMFTTRKDPLDSERLSGAKLTPIKGRKVVVKKIGHLAEMAPVPDQNRGRLTTKWRKLKVRF